jgi:hypothetical protein
MLVVLAIVLYVSATGCTRTPPDRTQTERSHLLHKPILRLSEAEQMVYKSF